MVSILMGCVSMDMPGNISERVSGFDKTKEIVMEPAWLISDSSPVKLGLYKTSKMDTDKAVLTVVVKGAYNFSDKESLLINIDGNILTLEPIDLVTNLQLDSGVYNSVASIPPANWSSKRYEITKDLIKRLIEGKEVWFKVNLSKDYAEGRFSQDNPMSARPAFKDFYKKVWESNSGDTHPKE